MILEGSLKPGQRLPPEGELAQQFGVSRPSLRDAIQTLAARGLLVSRQGGGNFVTENLNTRHTDPLLEMLGRHSEFHFDLLEFRDAMEVLAAYYAALRATPADKQVLVQRHEELEAGFLGEDPQREARLDAAFHLAIAEAAQGIRINWLKGLSSPSKRLVLPVGGKWSTLRSKEELAAGIGSQGSMLVVV